MEKKQITENSIIVENGKIKTLLTEQTIKNGYMSLAEARRLSHERLNKKWKLLKRNGY